MALYHLRTQLITRSQGKSAVAAAAYRSGQKLHDQRQDITFDYSKKHGVIHSEIMGPENIPEWGKDRETLWNHVEAFEKRINSRTAREIEVALPVEMTHNEQIELVREYISENFVKEGMIADFSIHDPEKSEHRNPHAHIMLTTRKIENGEFMKNKERSWDKKVKLTEWHEAWSTVQNQHLSKCGFDVRVDHRSYADRGVDIEPQVHMGPIKYIEETDLDRVKEYNRIAFENGKRIIENPEIAIKELTHHQAYFTETDILKISHRYSKDAEQYDQVKAAIGFSPELVTLGKSESGETCFTSREMLTAEQEMFEKTGRLLSSEKHQVKEKYLQQTISTKTLTPEQETALKHVAVGKDVSVIVGHAGTGKSYMLDAVREAYESQGYHVSGMALSGIAAENLQASSGIESVTIARKLMDWENGRGTPDKKSVLVVDEAGMTGTRDMHKIVSEAERAHAKLILVGDYQQLQPIMAGGAFRGIAEKTGYVELSQIRRQDREWQKEATTLLSGDKASVQGALDVYNRHDRLHLRETFSEAKESLLRDWSERIFEGERGIILAYRNKDVSELNAMARLEMEKKGQLGKESVCYETSKGRADFAENDRVLFLRNEYTMGVKNGSIGTVEGVKDTSLVVRLDDNKQIVIDPKEYNHFTHGYAATVHKSQGATFDRSYVLASAHFDKHLTLVSMSRHRDDMNMYLSKDNAGFMGYEHFRDVMSRDRGKGLVADFTRQRNIEVNLEGKGHIMTPEVGKRFYGSEARLGSLVDRVRERLNLTEREGSVLETLKSRQKGIDLDRELDGFRKINLAGYMEENGYQSVLNYNNCAVLWKKGELVSVYRRENGQYAYFSSGKEESRDIVDFVGKGNLAETRKELRGYVETGRRKGLSATPESREPVPREICGIENAKNSYYLKSIKLGEVNARFRGQVFSDDKRNVVFPYCDKDGNLSGLERKNQRFDGFSRGSTKTDSLWRSNRNETDNKLVITDSPVEAMSYHKLRGTETTRYVSFSGRLNDRHLAAIEKEVRGMPKGSDVVLAVEKQDREVLKGISMKFGHEVYKIERPKSFNRELQRMDRGKGMGMEL